MSVRGRTQPTVLPSPLYGVRGLLTFLDTDSTGQAAQKVQTQPDEGNATTAPTEWTPAEAVTVLAQLDANELSFYGKATRRHLREMAMATLAVATGVDLSTPPVGPSTPAGVGPEPPVVEVIDVTIDRRRNVRTVRIQCPHCGKRHIHGWPMGSTDPIGHRVSHCREGGAGIGYVITTPDDDECTS